MQHLGYKSSTSILPHYLEHFMMALNGFQGLMLYTSMLDDVITTLSEPPRGKTNNVVSEQVRHKPTCTSTEKS